MNDRLLKFLAAENISQAQFADTIGVARASVSHIIAGRNKPGFEFLERMARCYPGLNLEWLITGKGRMYRAESEESGGELFPDAGSAPVGRTISRIMVFYSDGTYDELK